MKIYTSYFGNVGRLPAGEKDFLVSIAGRTPDWFAGSGCRRFKKFTALAPSAAWWNEWKTRFQGSLDQEASRAWYARRYCDTVLKGRKPEELVQALSEICPDEDARFFLLCYETPEKFCHRQLVAEWFNSGGIGLTIEEY